MSEATTDKLDTGVPTPVHDHADLDAETVTDAWEGAAIYARWGYGQTNVDVARIVDVSDTGKTVVAQLATAERVDATRTDVRLEPTRDTYGDRFRLHVRNFVDRVAFRGSYPHATGEKADGTRRGSFYPWQGDPLRQTRSTTGH